MSWFFRKNKIPEKTAEEKKQECNHKWQDFPWYFEATYYENTRLLDAQIIEPYVCIYCKERKDVQLRRYQRTFDSFKKASDFIDNIERRYEGHIEDRAVVEDQIHDMQLVDREYLKFLKQVREGGPSIKDVFIAPVKTEKT